MPRLLRSHLGNLLSAARRQMLVQRAAKARFGVRASWRQYFVLETARRQRGSFLPLHATSLVGTHCLHGKLAISDMRRCCYCCRSNNIAPSCGLQRTSEILSSFSFAGLNVLARLAD